MIWAPDAVRSQHSTAQLHSSHLSLACCFAKPRAPVAANVIMRPDLARFCPNYEDAFPDYIENHKISRLLKLLLPSGAKPFPAKDALHLSLIDLLRQIVRAWQRFLENAFSSFHHVGHCFLTRESS